MLSAATISDVAKLPPSAQFLQVLACQEHLDSVVVDAVRHAFMLIHTLSLTRNHLNVSALLCALQKKKSQQQGCLRCCYAAPPRDRGESAEKRKHGTSVTLHFAADKQALHSVVIPAHSNEAKVAKNAGEICYLSPEIVYAV